MEGITVLTPTYNRAYTLEKAYKSLIDQSYKNFEWIIIDDGSKDDTKNIVEKWMQEDKIDIQYYYQNNRGKHIAHNLGVEKAKFNLFTCLDSDDWFYPGTLESIMSYSKEIQAENICGLIGLDTYENGKVVGDKFPESTETLSWYEIIFDEKIKGDKTIVFKTKVLKDYPFPENNLDKHMPPSYQLFLMSKRYKFKVVNDQMKFVEYLPDGITNNIRKKYEIAPNNYAEYRILMANISPTIKFKVKNLFLLNLSKWYTSEKLTFNKLNKKDILLTKIISPLSFLYYLNLKKRE